ncbi:hypothetical protein KDRO_B03210 [Kluyveromyces lactis]|nr:hypothetical protein KDRO_B03210 [Kluyveromyces lactis]
MTEHSTRVQFDLFESEKVLLRHKWIRILEEIDSEVSVTLEFDLYNTRKEDTKLHHWELKKVNQMRVGYDEFLLKKIKEAGIQNAK